MTQLLEVFFVVESFGLHWLDGDLIFHSLDIFSTHEIVILMVPPFLVSFLFNVFISIYLFRGPFVPLQFG